MLIRSQDKKIIANLNTAQGLSISGEYNIKVWHDGKVNNILGEYSTKAKAIKVLDMIQQNHINLTAFKARYPDHRECTSVFQMPQESEV